MTEEIEVLLSIVAINYNSGGKLQRCIDALLDETSEIDSEIIVINNASGDGSTDFLSGKRYSGITKVFNELPMGYTFAANQGFRIAVGRYILFSNPDMMVKEGTVHRMLAHMRDDPSLGGVAGYYLKPDSSFEKYYNRFPSVWSLFLTIYLPKSIAALFGSYRKYHMVDVEFGSETEVEQPAGAFLMVDREVFRDTYMSPKFGLMFSDVEVAWKIRMARKKIKVFKDCPVVHNHGERTMSRAKDISEEYLYTTDFFMGMWNYFRKYRGRGAALGVKLLFSLMLALTALAFFLKETFTLGRPFMVTKYRLLILLNFVLGKNPLNHFSENMSKNNLFFSKSKITAPHESIQKIVP